MILDTNAVSDWWLGTPTLLEIIQQASVLFLPVPVLAEYQFGILKSTRREKMQSWFDEAKRRSTLLPADANTATIYAEIRQNLETIGKKIPMNDLWIAAIARQHDLPVVSRDAHFDLVPDLKRLSW
jgi:tRNA(fMet)-specific endonuclease VapC